MKPTQIESVERRRLIEEVRVDIARALNYFHSQGPEITTKTRELQVAYMRNRATQYMLLGVLTSDELAAMMRSIEGPSTNSAGASVVNVEPAQVTFGPDSIRVDAPVTVRPVIDMTGDKEIVRRNGQIVGLRSVNNLAS